MRMRGPCSIRGHGVANVMRRTNARRREAKVAEAKVAEAKVAECQGFLDAAAELRRTREAKEAAALRRTREAKEPNRCLLGGMSMVVLLFWRSFGSPLFCPSFTSSAPRLGSEKGTRRVRVFYFICDLPCIWCSSSHWRNGRQFVERSKALFSIPKSTSFHYVAHRIVCIVGLCSKITVEQKNNHYG